MLAFKIMLPLVWQNCGQIGPKCSIERVWIHLTKVRSLLEHSCLILISFKIVVIFSIPHELTSKQSQLMLNWKWLQLWKKWGLSNCVLKVNGLYCVYLLAWKLRCQCKNLSWYRCVIWWHSLQCHVNIRMQSQTKL